jgi:hypothetical protein
VAFTPKFGRLTWLGRDAKARQLPSRADGLLLVQNTRGVYPWDKAQDGKMGGDDSIPIMMKVVQGLILPRLSTAAYVHLTVNPNP